MSTPSEQVTREIMGNVPAWLAAAFYTLAFASLAWAAWGFWRRGMQRRVGRVPEHHNSQSHGWRSALIEAVSYLAFHRKLRAGLAKDEALRQAMAVVRSDTRTAHPYYWAAFFLTGDPDNPNLGAEKRQ